MKISIKLFAFAMLMVVLSAGWAFADVAPGDVIDKTNVQKIEGLVPGYIVKWVKAGDMTMKIGKLDYHPMDNLQPAFQDKSNVGRYKIIEHNGLMDVKENKKHPHPHDVKGFPFPEVDTSDPTAPVQMMYNFNFHEYGTWPLHFNDFWLLVSRDGKVKTFEIEAYRIVFDKKATYDHGDVSRFKQPFNYAGTGSLVCNYIDPLKDGLRFVYSPLIRRVKRMSHRLPGSESNFDVYVTPDNAWGGGPRTDIENGRYKFIREQTALVPYLGKKPVTAVKNKNGGYETGFRGTGNKVAIGFEVPGWKGAPWHPDGVIWVKRPVYVIEVTSVNSNYRWGPSEGWIEKDTFAAIFKSNTDVNGNPWTGMYWVRQAFKSDDGKYQDLHFAVQVIVDLKSDKGSVFPNSRREGGFRTVWIKNVQKNLFTRAGFVKFTR